MKTVLMVLVAIGAVQSGDTEVRGRRLLVALEGGGAVVLDPRDGRILAKHDTGRDAFGAEFSPDGRRAFVTDKQAGTLVELGGATLEVGRGPQQPAVAVDGRIFVPLSGDAAIAVVRDGKVVRRIETGTDTKPHIVSLSPDGLWLWATVQGTDPKVLAIELTADGEKTAREFRYDCVPRVVSATNGGAWFTAHHSTGLHYASLADGKVTTPYLDNNGGCSEPRKQIEGVSTGADGRRVALTHEGRMALVMLEIADGKARKVAEASVLAHNPYWVTFDPSFEVAFVSIPGEELVEAYSFSTAERLWRSKVGGKAKRMAVSTEP